MNFRLIEDLTSGPYARPICREQVERLKASILEEGLVRPIEITWKNEVVDGWHRVQAAKELGWTEIQVEVVTNEEPPQLDEMQSSFQ